MPTITPQNIKSKLDTLENLGTVILKWSKDLDSAKAAKVSLEKFQKLSGDIQSYISTNLSKTTKEKKGSLLASYRDRLQEIKISYPTKGLTTAINHKIETLEAAKASHEDAKKKMAEKNEAALAEVRRLLPLITATVEAYAQARLEDKDALLSQFKQERELLNSHITLLSDKGPYLKQMHDLSHQVNKRSEVLALEEVQLKKVILETAKKAEKAVDQMTINQQILAFAPIDVKIAVTKLLAGIKPIDLQNLLILDGDVSEKSLVSYARGEIVALTGENSEIGKELAVLALLPQDQQLEVITALMSGQDSNGVLANVSQSTQMALTATLVNQLAIKAKIDKKDQLAIQEFSKGLVTSMARVERGEATHLSVLALVKDHLGKEVIAQFHIDLQALIKSSVDFSALMALNLLKLGVNADTKIVTAFTNLPQVGALLQLKGRDVSTLALEDRGLQQLTEAVLANPSTIKQITNGEVEDASDDALIAATKYSNAIVLARATTLVVGKQEPKVKPGTNLVADVIRALAVLNLTVQATVINASSKQALGITNLIGNAPRLMIEGDNLVAVAASEPKAIEHFPIPNPVISVTNVETPKPVINQQLIANFTEALEKLRSLQASLVARYGKNTSKQYIIVANARLIDVLSNALSKYTLDGNHVEFKKACQDAITDEVKNQFNTHRDAYVTQFFAAIAQAFGNLWNVLFASAESKQTRAGLAGFFNSNSRPTRSADELYTFNRDLEKAFGLIGVQEESLDHELSSQALVKC